MKIVNLFGEQIDDRPKKITKNLFSDYEDFVDKFQAKLTTDDCYTPDEVYSVILEWIGENYDLSGKNICRPFYPNGDYQAEVYKPNDIVIDNPPFSILADIVDYYDVHKIKFFLFAPELTAFVRNENVCNIYAGQNITYHNGAKVATSYISNLWDDLGVWVCADLGRRIKEAQEANKQVRQLPKYNYPENVVTSVMLGTLASRGGELKILRKHISRKFGALRSQIRCGKGAFGGCRLISDAAAHNLREAEIKAIELKAKEQKNKQDVVTWELSEAELLVIESLNRY